MTMNLMPRADDKWSNPGMMMRRLSIITIHTDGAT